MGRLYPMETGGFAKSRLIPIVILVAAALLVGGYLLLFAPRLTYGQPAELQSRPAAVMSTDCELTVVVPPRGGPTGRRALEAGERALRGVEARMSGYLEASELSKLNAAAGGQFVSLSSQTMEVLRISREIAGQTDGAFDVTCAPIINLWRRAGRTRRLPDRQEIARAVGETGWEHFELLENGARKHIDTAAIDLGGIAKGYGIDQAAKAMTEAGAKGGLVNVGGDVRGFGWRPHGKPWRVGVRDPFDKGSMLTVLAIRDSAVCTSGNYERGFTFEGKRYSHITDPRTGWAADMTPSVTAVAPTGAVADAWATALSVLGVEGFALIPPGSEIEAMIVVGTPGEYELHVTEGFPALFADSPGTNVRVHRRTPASAAAEAALPEGGADE